MSDSISNDDAVNGVRVVADELKNFVILSSNGQLDLPGVSTSQNVQRIVQAAVDGKPENGLVLYFHGGLTSRAAGPNNATLLKNSYYVEAATYPVFFVWESGFGETLDDLLQKMLTQIAGEKLFQSLRKWLPHWVKSHPEHPLSEEAAGYVLRRDGLEEQIRADIASDPEFQNALREVFQVASGTQLGFQTNVAVLPDKAALEQMFGPADVSFTSESAWNNVKTWHYFAGIVVNLLRRIAHHRTHGTEPTVVEEILSAVYLNSVGADIWKQMKDATANAFGSESRAGTTLLETLSDHASSGKAFEKVTLIGHSAGAIYISNFIKNASKILPNLTYDVIFLAPAIRHDEFATMLGSHQQAVRNFRMFSMSDAYETEDHLVNDVYVRSLLYFIAGVLEKDELEDMPLLGMQRYLNDTGTFNGSEFPAVDTDRRFLTAVPNRTAWSVSPTNAPEGLRTAARQHGGFALEAETKASIVYILKEGFGS
ncbi:hypothetical protein P3T23_001045 [Paraburkholderia sp. GAS448]|uniref:hypothetical protein n=1 Tax=Paraburkholderia sp. GAS448 TaxID=3035136 RepID=UPI003D212AF8